MSAARSMPSHGDLAVPRAGTTVRAVVVSYNTRGLLERCLLRLSGEHESVLVVDSASSDGSVELVRAQFPAVELVACSENRGFGAAANRGIARLDDRYVLLLNADAWPLPGAVGKLVSVAENNPRAGLIAPRLLNLDGSPQRSVFGYPTSPASLASWAAFPGLVSNAFKAWRVVSRFIARMTQRGDPSSDFERVRSLASRGERRAEDLELRLWLSSSDLQSLLR